MARLPKRVVFNSAINQNDWEVLNDVWGYTETQTHGGVIDDNVTFDDDGNLVLIANGDWYVGEKQGIVNSNNISVSGGQRTGSAIQSATAYGPGSFEVVIKLPSFNGICTALWLYNYRDNGGEIPNDNWEIDIEVHGTAIGGNSTLNAGNYANPLFTTWVTEKDYTSQYKNIGYSLADGQFHSLRIDWHTGANPRVEYYVDGVLWCTQTTNVPTNKMFVNIGCWFPNNWCGQPTFETDYAVVKSFAYTPFVGETATEINCQPNASGGWLSNVAIPTKNLVANGSFDYAIANNNAWVLDGELQTAEQGNVAFVGTLGQQVTTDTLGNSYNLLVSGNGNGNVKVTYQSIVDGVEVTGYVTGELNQNIHFVPPTNCTRLLVEITSSNGTLTLSDVSLNICNSTC